jgi:hypothetical protein
MTKPFNLIERALHAVLLRVAARLPARVIDGLGGPYLTKYLIHRGGREGISIHLHRFHRDNEDREHHNHP